MGAGKDQHSGHFVSFDDSHLRIDVADSAMAECRICQEEEEDPTNLETPCACSGSLKYAHRTCIQRWCNEKGDVNCEICQQPYKDGYTASSSSGLQLGSVSIDVSDDWGIGSPHPIGLRDPRLLALAVAQRQFLESEYEEYESATLGSTVCCRTVALILMTLLLLRHTLTMVTVPVDSDGTMFILAFILRIVGFFLPCYIMIRGMSALNRDRRQGSTLTAAEISILLQAAGPESIRIALAPPGDSNNQNEQEFGPVIADEVI